MILSSPFVLMLMNKLFKKLHDIPPIHISKELSLHVEGTFVGEKFSVAIIGIAFCLLVEYLPQPICVPIKLTKLPLEVTKHKFGRIWLRI